MPFHKKYIPIIIGSAIALGVLLGGKLNFTDRSDRLFTSNSKKDKLNRLIDYIDHEYVDDVNTDSIVDITVNKILDNLDPHSTYIPKEDLKQVTENMKGDFVGIGLSFRMYRDSVTVIRPLEGGPSIKEGIKAGDRIITANGEPIYGKSWSNEAVISRLKGEKNTTITLEVYRKGEPELLTFNVTRSEVPLKSVDAAYMLNDSLGYIKINRFAESTFKEFKKALNQMKQKGPQQLVLDLRDNPGGFLSVAEQIADEFLEDDKLILFTKNNKGKVEKTYATKKGDFEKGEVYILINENSASASEIIAGALQDNDKGTIIGRRSFGKGLVQREMALGDGSAIRLTVSRYYTPTGRSIQRSYKNGNKDYYNDYYKRIDNGELSNVNNIHIADSLTFKTPNGKTVYGGGGIIPDIFVPIDIKVNNETVKRIVSSGIIDDFVFLELDNDRSLFITIDKEDFISNFQVTNDVFSRFIAHLRQQTNRNIPLTSFTAEIKQYIKASLARQLFDDESYFRIINKNDKIINTVVKIEIKK